MNLYKFIAHEEIEMVAESIKNKVDFEIERECKGYQLWLKSSRAAADFMDGTKEGDYIVLENFSTNTCGGGGPLSGEELKELENVDKLTRHLDKFLTRREIEGYVTLDEGQMSIFEMMV